MPSVSPKNKYVCRGRKVQSCERKKSCKKTLAGKRRSYCRSRKNKMLKKLMSSSSAASPVSPAKPVSKSIKNKQQGYGFELRFGLNKSIIPDNLINKYGKKLEENLGKTLFDNGEKWNWVESGEEVSDVSKLPQQIKDFLTEDLLIFMQQINSDSYNQTTYGRAVFGKGKNYISVKGTAEHPITEIMQDGASLESHIEVINEKSIWQSFHGVYPIYKNELYQYVSVFIMKIR